MPIFAKYRAEMPLDCPLHEARDVYQPLHQARAVLGTGRWGCRLCGKAFVSQVIDHFETEGEIGAIKSKEARTVVNVFFKSQTY